MRILRVASFVSICLGVMAAAIGQSMPGVDFRDGTFAGIPHRIEPLVRDWYTKHLRAAGKKSLIDGKNRFAVQFIYLRTFHHPIVVTVDQTNGVWEISGVELSGAGGYDPGHTCWQSSASLAESDLKWIRGELDSMEFGYLAPWISESTFDGSEWVLEVRDGAHYRAVRRWAPGPGEDGAFRAYCEQLLTLARVIPPQRDLY